MKNRPLVTQFRFTLFLIVSISIVASVITYVGAFLLFLRALNHNELLPENYYEQQIPEIETYIREAKSTILSSSCEKDLNQFMMGDGLTYQVVDRDGNILYGSYPNKIIESKEHLYRNLNRTINQSGYYIHIVPVIDATGKIEGAVLLAYKLSLISVNRNNGLFNLFFIVIIFSPFLYFIVFTILFSRIFTKNITRPLKLLVEGSRQIKNKNLNFHIDYHSRNELGELCSAFGEMKEELKKSLSTQWKLEQEQIDIVEALAHDLKSPLSIMKAYSEAMTDDTEVDEEQRQYLAVIDKNIEKSISLVQQMQYTSDLSTSSVRLNPETVNLSAFLERKVYDYEVQARQKDISVSLTARSGLPTSLWIDIDKLERILDNLLSNSLQYTPPGGQITIEVKEEKDAVIYKICDSGTGFSAKDMEKAFEKFYRGDEARQTKDAHSGLGLYIVKHLAELLGGAVKIENSKSGGACVTFWHSKP